MLCRDDEPLLDLSESVHDLLEDLEDDSSPRTRQVLARIALAFAQASGPAPFWALRGP